MSTEKILDIRKMTHWPGHMETDYIYTLGITGEKFFTEIKENGKILGVKCKRCEKVYVPPRMYCEDCYSEIPLDEWIEVPASGIVKLQTVVTIDSYGKKLVKPRIIGMIKIDNTDGLLLGVIKTENIEEDLRGKQVKAVFQTQSKREGTLKDILYFTKK